MECKPHSYGTGANLGVTILGKLCKVDFNFQIVID